MARALASTAALLLTPTALAGGEPPFLQATLDTFSGDVALVGRVLYETDFFDRTRVYDAEFPCVPVSIGSIQDLGATEEIQVSGGLAAIRSPFAGVQIVDIADPANPQILSVVNLPGEERRAIIRDGFLYVATQSFSPVPSSTISRLSLANPASPGAPQFVLNPPASVFQFDVSDGILVHPAGVGLRNFDVSGPTPVDLGTLFFVGGFPSLPTFVGDTLIVTLTGIAPSSVRLIDFTDPAAVVGLGDLDIDGRIVDLDVEGDTLYLAVQEYSSSAQPDVTPGVQAIDLSDPDNPATRWFLETGGDPRFVDASDGLVDVSSQFAMTRIYADEFCIPALGCNAADLAEPYSTLNFNDAILYLEAFGMGAPQADLAEPFDVLNFNDILAFLELFTQGCPG